MGLVCKPVGGTPICSSTSLAGQVAELEELSPEGRAISVMPAENPIHLGLWILDSRLESLQQPTEDNIPFLSLRRNTDDSFSVKEDIENLILPIRPLGRHCFILPRSHRRCKPASLEWFSDT